MKFIEHWRK